MKKNILLVVVTFLSISVFAQTDSYTKSIRAYIIAQDFVKAKLNHPKDAEFFKDVVHELDGYGKCILLGKVDAKNSYGITTRYVYKIWLKHNGRDWTEIYNWSFSKLIIENATTKKQSVFYQ